MNVIKNIILILGLVIPNTILTQSKIDYQTAISKATFNYINSIERYSKLIDFKSYLEEFQCDDCKDPTFLEDISKLHYWINIKNLSFEKLKSKIGTLNTESILLLAFTEYDYEIFRNNKFLFQLYINEVISEDGSLNAAYVESFATLTKQFKLQEGETVAQIFSTSDIYAFILAYLYPETNFYIHSPDSSKLSFTGKNLDILSPDIQNLNLISDEEDVLKLDKKLDLIFLHETFDQLKNPIEILSAIKDNLKADGELIIIEKVKPKIGFSSTENLLTDKQILNCTRQAGYRLVKSKKLIPNYIHAGQYLLVFKKK